LADRELVITVVVDGDAYAPGLLSDRWVPARRDETVRQRWPRREIVDSTAAASALARPQGIAVWPTPAYRRAGDQWAR
jgi:hypothetical protein